MYQYEFDSKTFSRFLADFFSKIKNCLKSVSVCSDYYRKETAFCRFLADFLIVLITKKTWFFTEQIFCEKKKYKKIWFFTKFHKKAKNLQFFSYFYQFFKKAENLLHFSGKKLRKLAKIDEIWRSSRILADFSGFFQKKKKFCYFPCYDYNYYNYNYYNYS